jgi:heterodisulfide reductase subunit C
MPERTALITALILDRPMCLDCIAEKSLVTDERAEEALAAIAIALVLRRETGRCIACGVVTAVCSVGRPPDAR